jgi:hypothetical protein
MRAVRIALLDPARASTAWIVLRRVPDGIPRRAFFNGLDHPYAVDSDHGLRLEPNGEAQSPRPATPTPAATGRGRLAPPPRLPQPRRRHASPLEPRLASGQARGRRATTACTNAGRPSSPARKKTVVANVAIARELAGWCWSLAVLDD